VCWSSDGRQLLSAGLDKVVLLWDVETGRVKGSFKGNGAMPYCVVFNPDKETEFLVGCADKKVIQMDVRDGNAIVQTYEHMGAVNSISFVDENRRFVSSSDDKVIRVWDVGIPICLKYVSDPTMHSCPVTELHPNTKWIACQSMDNTVRVYGVLDRFRLNAKKRIEGHLVAGYACGLSFSPDGRFIASGDAMGRAFFWDWKTSRMLRALQGHKGVCIDVAWHPTVPSRVASCGWDGNIKLWD
jgi:pre-mRNA-processing factor 17